MGIEPTREALPSLENERFGAMAAPKCDGRVNFRGMWGHVGIHRWVNPGLARIFLIIYLSQRPPRPGLCDAAGLK
jgi:hypothetical protein